MLQKISFLSKLKERKNMFEMCVQMFMYNQEPSGFSKCHWRRGRDLD